MRLKVLALAVAVAGAATLAVPDLAEAQRLRPRFGPYYRPLRTSVYFAVGFGGPLLYSPWGFYPWGYYPYWQRYPYYYGAGPRVTGIRIQVEPKSAAVYVDGEYAGTVDDFDGFFQRLYVSPGGHEITIYLQGYRSIVERLYVQPGITTHIKAKMQRLAPGEPEDPLPQPPAGRVMPPPGSGQERQLPPDQAARPRVPRPVQPVRPVPPVRPDEPAVGAPAGYGQLALRWQPADAAVMVDGEPWHASAPGERLLLHLAAGPHHVEIRKEGFVAFVTDVQVRAGETTVLNVSLTERR